MVIIKDYNKRTFICQGVSQEMFVKLTEFGGVVEHLIVDGKRGSFWAFPMRKKNSVIDYFLMADIDYTK